MRFDPNSQAVTDALRQWRGRTPFPTDLGSAELRTFSRELMERSVVTARGTNAQFVQELQNVLDDMLAGKINLATGRWRMMKLARQLGYDPETGFPDDMANVPPAERDSLQDLSSERRLDFTLETNQRMAANYAIMKAGHTDYALYAYPAWRLVRIYVRTIERGSPESHTAGWAQRWQDAGDAVGWAGASRSQMVALKVSPIWEALGNGAGGYIDTLRNPYPPFAFGSGLGWTQESRKLAIELGLIDAEGNPINQPGASTLPQRPAPRSFSPGEEEVRDMWRNLSPELRRTISRQLKEAA